MSGFFALYSAVLGLGGLAGVVLNTHTHTHIFFFPQGPLAFAPTYKFNPDSEEYSGGGKGRVRHVCVSV